MFKRFALPALLAIFALAVTGQAMSSSSTEHAKKFGIEPDSAAVKIEISNLLKNPESYLEKTIVIAGRIKDECPGGHWFILHADEDTTNQIFVNLRGSKFVLPQVVGSRATVYGMLVLDDGKPSIDGLGVELNSTESEHESQTGHSSSHHSCCH